MGQVCDMPICGTCGCDWAVGDWSTDCAECGGGAMARACPVCGGKCGAQFQRAVADSHNDGAACWVGECAG